MMLPDSDGKVIISPTRSYGTEIGRFLQEDPDRGLGLPNDFLYVNDAPVISNDPTGLVPCRGGRWWVSGPGGGGQVFVGYQRFEVTWQCRRRLHVRTRKYCCCGHQFEQKVYHVPTARGRIISALLGIGVGGGGGYMVGYVSGAPSSENIGKGWRGSWGGISASLSVVVGMSANWSPGSKTGAGEGGLGARVVVVGTSWSWPKVYGAWMSIEKEDLGSDERKLIKECQCTIDTEILDKPKWVSKPTPSDLRWLLEAVKPEKNTKK
jgi:hypothetical protein